MPFSDATRSELLVRSRRSCCICHRFRGTNIEVHHIRPEAQVGSSDAENGIPLCFDCHADVEHYNANHPKGTKYSPRELKAHRDGWFARVTETGVQVSTDAHVAIDQRVADEIHRSMTVSHSYEFLRDHTLWDGFPGEKTEPIFHLHERFRNLDMQFMDADLESHRAVFASSLFKAVDAISLLTYPHDTRENWFTAGGELAIFKYGLQDQIKAGDQACSKAAEAYAELFSLVRQKLGIDLRF